MTALELQKAIDKWEDIHTEFKAWPIHPDQLAAALVAFANTDGGRLILGVHKEHEIVGVDDPDKVMQKVDQVAYQNCEPPLTAVQETVQADDHIVVVVNIPKGDQRPYRTNKGDYFIRTTSGRRRASRQELLRLFQAVKSLYYEETLVVQASVDDVDQQALSLFRKQIGIDTQIDHETLLKNWRLIGEREKSFHPTIVAILLFGREPQIFIPYAYISAARIPGTNSGAPPSDAKRIDGTLFSMLEDTARFLRVHLQVPHEIEGFEPEAHPELPEVALRETIVNALVHRDYTISAPIRIFIFDDRVEVRSPGELPNTVSIDMIKSGLAHVLRNPIIYSFFNRAGLVTDTGNGILRVIRTVKDTVGREPELKMEGNELAVSLPRTITDA